MIETKRQYRFSTDQAKKLLDLSPVAHFHRLETKVFVLPVSVSNEAMKQEWLDWLGAPNPLYCLNETQLFSERSATYA